MSDEELVRRLRNTTIAIQPIFPTLRHEAADAIERLTRERDDCREDYLRESKIAAGYAGALFRAERKVEVLREVLRPFAACVSRDGMCVVVDFKLASRSDFINARAALDETEETNVD